MITQCPGMTQWHQNVPGRSRGPILFGISIIVIWIAGFVIWAFRAPIDGAVVTQGSFVATGQNKLVQHLEGGILREMRVKEGDMVKEGQVVARLDETAANARLRRLTQRLKRMTATQARLHAEIEAKSSIAFPHELLAADATIEDKDIVSRQQMEFEVRQTKLAGDIEVLRREVGGHEEALVGLAAQLKATDAQTKLFQAELEDKQALLDKLLTRRSEVMALKRAEARSVGDSAQLLSRIGDLKERILRVQQQMAQIQSAAMQRAIEELRSTETEIDDMREQIKAAEDVLARVDIRAPVSGIVVKLHQSTRGGVIAPGATLMELLPVNDELVIEARVMPGDVVHVKDGQSALVRLTSANQRLVPFIEAKVTYVSADAVTDSDPRHAAYPGLGTFVVRVHINDPELGAKIPQFVPIPGMPAEVFIRTGERTFFEYIVKPITDSFARAFRES